MKTERFTFRVEVEVEHAEGEKAEPEAIVESIREVLDEAEPEHLYLEGDADGSTYKVTSWEARELEEEKPAPRRRRSASP